MIAYILPHKSGFHSHLLVCALTVTRRGSWGAAASGTADPSTSTPSLPILCLSDAVMRKEEIRPDFDVCVSGRVSFVHNLQLGLYGRSCETGAKFWVLTLEVV